VKDWIVYCHWIAVALAVSISVIAEEDRSNRHWSESPESKPALRVDISEVSKAMSELDHEIAREWDRMASLLHRINAISEPLPALVNLRKRLERENKLQGLMSIMERSKVRSLEERPEVPSQAKPIEPTDPSIGTNEKKSWKRPVALITPRKERPRLNRGKYYLFPFAGVLFPTNRTYEVATGDAKLGGNTGYTLGMTAGKRFGNWTGELSFGISRHKFTSFRLPLPPASRIPISGDGDSHLLNVSSRIGYAVPLSEDLWIRFGGGLGFGHRADEGEFNFLGIRLPLDTSKEVVFSYESFAELGYGFTEHLRAGMAYRYLGAGENGKFGAYGAHLIELSLGGDF
jgi:hypothetical protein